jgi:hypothetical protein
MKIILHILLTIASAFIFAGTVNATTYTATTTGNWSAVGTWDVNGVPDNLGSADVIINDAVVVTANVNFTINNLTIGRGTSGSLRFNGTTSLSLVINGDLLINAGGVFQPVNNTLGGSNTGLSHALVLKGNITNNGTFTPRTGSATSVPKTLNVVNITLSGSTNSTLNTKVTAYAASSNANMFNSLTINKSGAAKVILTSNWVMSAGSSSAPLCNAFLTFINGIIETGSYYFAVLSTTDTLIKGYSSAGYVNGCLGRGMSNSGAGNQYFPVGDATGFELMNVRSTTGGAATGHCVFVRCISGNANMGSSLLVGGIDKVSSVRYYKVSYGTIGAGQTSMSFDRFRPSYNLDDGVSAGNTDLRVAYSLDSMATWTGFNQTIPDTTNLFSPPVSTHPDTLPYPGCPVITLFAGGTAVFITLASAAGTIDNHLPIELSSFSGNANGRSVSLSWETKTEINSDKFFVERKTIELNWESIGSVKAAVLSNSPKQYSYTDKNLQSGKYQYRLKMIDNDGTFEYSKVIETEVAVPGNFELSQNFPNPWNPLTKINYTLPFDSKVILEVYNISGERISQLVNEEQSAGYYSVNFGSSSISLSSGVYIYRIVASGQATGNSFSAIKKMILLK